MATISVKSWDRYINALRKLNTKATNRMLAKIHEVGTDDREALEELIRYAYGIATRYGEGASALSAEMYDALAELSGKIVPPAVPAPTASYGDVAKAVYGTNLQSKNPQVMADSIGRLVKMAGVDTMQQNALRDGAEWAWIPRGDTCAFCIMLASNGWQRASKKAIKNGHAMHIHANCDCTYAIRFNSDVDVEGYNDGQEYRDMYYGAEGSTPEERINSIRRRFYAENKGLVGAESSKAEEFIPKVQLREFTPAKTKKEAEEFAKNFAENINLNGVSLDNINKINDQLNTLTQKYPINKLDHIETGGRGVMSANWRGFNIQGKKLGKTLNDEELNYKLNKAMAEATIKQWQDKYAGAKMPPHVVKIIEQQKRKTLYERWGVQSKYEDHVKATVTHEYGHILSDQYFGMINGERANPNISLNWSIKGMNDRWKQVYTQALKSGDIYKISEYASKNVREFFAECFAMREMGDSLPDYIETLMKEVLDNGIMQ